METNRHRDEEDQECGRVHPQHRIPLKEQYQGKNKIETTDHPQPPGESPQFRIQQLHGATSIPSKKYYIQIEIFA